MFSYPDRTQHIFFRWEFSPNGRWMASFYYDEKPTKMYGDDILATSWVTLPMNLPFVDTEKLLIDEEVVKREYPAPVEHAMAVVAPPIYQPLQVPHTAINFLQWAKKLRETAQSMNELADLFERCIPDERH